MRVGADWISWNRTLNVNVLSYSNPVLFEKTWFFPCKFLKLSYLDMQKISINGADRFWPREPPYFALFNVVVLVVWHFHLICLTPFQMSPVPSLHNRPVNLHPLFLKIDHPAFWKKIRSKIWTWKKQDEKKGHCYLLPAFFRSIFWTCFFLSSRP